MLLGIVWIELYECDYESHIKCAFIDLDMKAFMQNPNYD